MTKTTKSVLEVPRDQDQDYAQTWWNSLTHDVTSWMNH